MHIRKRGKRAVAVVLFSALLIGGMTAYPRWREARLPSVQTVMLTPQTVERTAVCSGTVQASDSVAVYASVPCVAGKMAVQTGDRVQEGDVLLDVDKAATLSAAVSAGLSDGQSAAVSSLLPTALTAPVSGVVSAVNIQEGETVDTATPCAVIASGDGIEVTVAVRESLLPKLTLGQRVTVSGDGFAKAQYGGTLTAMADSARTRLNGTATETVVDATVTLDADDLDDSLLIGLNAKAELVLERYEEALLVPYTCLTQTQAGAASVYVWQDGQAVRREITLGAELAEGAVALAGLSAGEELIVDPEALGSQASVAVRREAA